MFYSFSQHRKGKEDFMNIQYADTIHRLPQQFFATLVNKVQALVSDGHDIINLGQGNPDGSTPDHIIKKMQEAVNDPMLHRYSPFTGFSFLKEAASTFYKREYNVDIDPETEVAILFGAKTGLVEISQCLLNPGDIVLVPDPGYPDYLSGISIAGAKMHRMPLTIENNFLPRYDTINTNILDKAKMMFLNYPNNPTAATATEEFYKETVDIANRFNVAIIHDFAYGALGFDGKKPISFMQIDGAKEVGIEIYTLSKTYNMAGWRVAFAVGHPDIIRVINLIQEHYYVSLFGAVQAAAAEALTGPQNSVKSLVSRYESRRDTLYQALNQIGWQGKPSQGTFFAWLPVPKGYTSTSFADLLLEQAHIVVAPGIGFGQYGDKYIRLGLLANEDRLLTAVERIHKLHLFD